MVFMEWSDKRDFCDPGLEFLMPRNADLAPFSAARSFEAAARRPSLSTASADHELADAAKSSAPGRDGGTDE